MSTDLEVERLLTGTFMAVAEEVPSLPPMTWSEAKHAHQVSSGPSGTVTSAKKGVRRRAAPWLLSVGLMVGGAGAGVAAAAGVFSSPAAHQLQQISSLPLPVSFGRIPTFDPHKVKLEVTDPGPGGTTISVWTYPESKTIHCLDIVESQRGEDLVPGHGPAIGASCTQQNVSPSGATSTSLPAPQSTYDYGGGGFQWRSNTGALYWLTASRAPTGATRVVLTFVDGTMKSIPVANGWFAVGYADPGNPQNFNGVFYGSSGQRVTGTAEGLFGCPHHQHACTS
jgi:hypothetical protein